MKKLALTIAVFFCLLVAAFAQPLKSTGLWYFQGAPDVVPASIKGVEVAVSLDEQKVYVWDRTGSAWVDILDGVSFDADQIEDIVGALMVRSPQDGVSVVYDDVAGTLSITADVTAQSLTDSLNAVRVKIPTSLSDLPNDAGFITDPDDADASPVNEIQALTISNDTIFLTGGGFVKIPPQPTPDAQDVQAGDAGAYYATENVEDQLQEAGADRAQIQSSIPTNNSSLTNGAGYTTVEVVRDSTATKQITYTAEDVSASEVLTETEDRSVNFTLVMPDTVTQDYTIELPSLSDLSAIELVLFGDYNTPSYAYKLVSSDSDVIALGNTDRLTQSYRIGNGERVTVSIQDGKYAVEITAPPVATYFEDELTGSGYYERSEINYKEGAYTLQKALPAGVALPNIAVIELKDKSPFGENLIYRSENFQDIGGANRWSASGSIDNNVALDLARSPDGLYTADRFSVSAGAGFGTLKQTITSSLDTRLRLGDPVTFSFYVKTLADGVRIQYISFQDGGAGNASIGGQASGFIVQNVRPGDEWQRYEYTTTVVLDSVISPVINLAFNLDSTFPEKTEIFDIYGAQLERTERASPYKRTFDTQSLKSDILYATLKLDDSFVKLTDIYIPSNDTKAITEQSIAYCEATPGCKGVELADGMIFTEGNILIPENFTLQGNGRETTVITYSPSDTSETLFISRDDPGTYIPGIEYKNFTVTVTDTCYAVIDSRHGLQTLFERIQINGNYFPRYCVKVGKAGQESSLRSNFFYSNIFSGREANVLYENCGNNHRITGGTFSRAPVALKSDVQLASLTIDKSNFEDNDIAFDFREGGGNIVDVINTYFEQVTNSPSPDYYLGRFETMRFIGGFQTMSEFVIGDRLGTLTFSGVGFNLNPVFLDEQGGIAKPRKFSIKDCSFNRSTGAELLRAVYDGYPWFEMTGASATADGGDYRMPVNIINGLYSVFGKIREGILDGGYVGGKIATSNLEFVGGEQNLSNWSDSLAVPGTAEIVVEHNFADGRFGEPNAADLFRTVTTGNINSPLKLINLSETIAKDTAFTVSFYAKNIGTENYAFRVVGPDFSDVVGIVSPEYKRYEIHVDSSSVDRTSLTIQTRGRVLGDSILFSGWQVNYGLQALPYVATTTTGINQDSIANIDGTINFLGPVNFEQPIPGVKEQYQEDFTATASQSTVIISAATTAIDIKDIEVFWGIDNVSLVKILSDPTTGYSWDAATKTVTFNGITISDGDKINVVWNE